MSSRSSTAKESFKSLFSGGMGGMCCVIVGHPIDCVKVRMQTMVVKPGETPPFTGTFDCLRKTAAKEGIRGLYRGVSAPMTGVIPNFAMAFWGFDAGKSLVRFSHDIPDASVPLSMTQISIAGGISALPQTVVMAPSERIKCLLQVQANVVERGGTAEYAGMVDCARRLYATGGIRSIYRGTCATLLRDVPGNIAYFGTYEYVRRTVAAAQGRDSAELSFGAIIVAGGLAGMANWLVALPQDVLKSRLQTDVEGKYRGVLDVLRELLRKEKPTALFRGIGPAMIRAFPANAATFTGVELARNAVQDL